MAGVISSDNWHVTLWRMPCFLMMNLFFDGGNEYNCLYTNLELLLKPVHMLCQVIISITVTWSIHFFLKEKQYTTVLFRLVGQLQTPMQRHYVMCAVLFLWLLLIC